MRNQGLCRGSCHSRLQRPYGYGQRRHKSQYGSQAAVIGRADQPASSSVEAETQYG